MGLDGPPTSCRSSFAPGVSPVAPCYAMRCDPDHPTDVRAECLLSLLSRGPRTYYELSQAGLREDLPELADAIERAGRGRIVLGPYVELVGRRPDA